MTTRPVQSAALARRPARRESMVVEKVVVVSLRLTEKLQGMVDAAVEKSGLTTQEWIRAVLARAANEGAFAPRKGDRHGSKPKRKPAE